MNDYNEFYQVFIEKLTNSRKLFPADFTIPNHQINRAYLGYSTGRGGLKYYTEYTSRGYGQGYVGFIVGVYIDGQDYEYNLQKLKQHKNTIEDKLGEHIYWINTGRAGRIFFRLDESFGNSQSWDNVMDWEIKRLSMIINVFSPYIREL